MARSTHDRDISQIPRLATPLVDIAVAWQDSRNGRAVLNRAKERNVKCILPGITVDCSLGNSDLCQQFCNDKLLFTAGVHPNYIPGSVARADSVETRLLEHVIRDLREIAKRDDCVAIGETGLDYNRNPHTYRKQQKWCAEQVRLACEMELPLFMHERQAFDDLDKILNQIRTEFGRLPPIVIHCFTGKRCEAQRYIEAGFYIGVTGFLVKEDRGRKLRDFIKDVVPLGRLLLETDSPYMGFGETDHRCLDFERNNEPCTLPLLALKIAELYNVDVETVARITTSNAQRFYRRDFGLSQVATIAPVVSQASSLAITVSQSLAEAQVSCSALSTAEKEALKLARTLRQIMKLEQSSAHGETLLDNQRAKVASKASIAAALLDMMELLSPTSHIIQKVQDVIIAWHCTEDGQVGGQSEVEALVEAPRATMESVLDVEPHVAHGQACVMPMAEAPAETFPAMHARERRWRTRAGRSGFIRKYSADHSEV